ncbi:MAG: nucleotidyltransferase family protein [Gammaproteobacteria bacterium]
MILAAGRGERMRPLTDTVPKPLLPVAGKPLLEWHLQTLADAGFRQVVINVSWLAEAVIAAVGDGHRWGLEIHISNEGEPPLETGGGIFQALPRLGSGPFLVINGDVWSDVDLSALRMPEHSLAHLLMVPNPAHHPEGDFHLHHGRLSAQPPGRRLTFSGIGLYRPALFAECRPGRFALAPLLSNAMAEGRVSGQIHTGVWQDVGTVDRLRALRDSLSDNRRDNGT